MPAMGGKLTLETGEASNQAADKAKAENGRSYPKRGWLIMTRRTAR